MHDKCDVKLKELCTGWCVRGELESDGRGGVGTLSVEVQGEWSGFVEEGSEVVEGVKEA